MHKWVDIIYKLREISVLNLRNFTLKDKMFQSFECEMMWFTDLIPIFYRVFSDVRLKSLGPKFDNGNMLHLTM